MPASPDRIDSVRRLGGLRVSIQQLGLGRSIVTDKNNVVIAGNKTWEKAAEVGISKLRVIETAGDEPVVVNRSDLDLAKDPRARKLAVDDNRISQINLDFDPAILQGVLSPWPFCCKDGRVVASASGRCVVSFAFNS